MMSLRPAALCGAMLASLYAAPAAFAQAPPPSGPTAANPWLPKLGAPSELHATDHAGRSWPTCIVSDRRNGLAQTDMATADEGAGFETALPTSSPQAPQ